MLNSSLPFTSKLFKLTALTLALTLAGCGGGGDGDTVDSVAPAPDTGLVQVTPNNPGSINPGNPAVQASAIYVSSNYSGIKMTKGASIEITALVLDKNNGQLVEQPVTFKITNPNTTGVFSDSQSLVETDESGKAVIRLEVTNTLSEAQREYLLNTGLTIEASVGGVSKTLKVFGLSDDTNVQKENAYDVYISSNKTQLLTGEDKTTVSIRVTDKQGGVVSGVPVIMSIADAALYGLSLNSISKQLTNNEGLVEVDLIQSRVGIDAQLDHESLLTVTVDDEKNSIVEQNLPIIVSGTRTRNVISSKRVVEVGENFNISGQVIDGALKAVANADVVLYSNGKEAGVGNTDNNGNFVFYLNASNLEVVNDGYLFSIEVKGDEVTQRIPDILTVVSDSSSNMNFLQRTKDIEISKSETITLNVPDANEGDIVYVSTNKGTLNGTTSSRLALSVTNKKVTFDIISQVPGIATIRAEHGSDTKETTLSFVSTNPTKLLLQIERAVVSVGGSTEVIAKVLDKDDAPVKNAVVQFTVIRDASGGSLSQGVAYTDDSGRAKVTYNAGQNPTSTNGVTVQALVESVRLPDSTEKPVKLPDGSSRIADSSEITVQTKSTFISFAFANTVSSGDRNVYYYRKGSISVLNNTGKPAINQQVSVNLIPHKYGKGKFYVYKNEDDEKVWGRGIYTFQTLLPTDARPNQPYATCDNEDLNNNGILDLGEDINSNGQLDPVNVVAVLDKDGNEVSVNSSQSFNLTTDAFGKIDFSVRYPKEYAQWYQAKITVNTGVDGSESQQARFIDFPVLVDDVDISVPIRPNPVSPFGVKACTDAN